MRFHRCTSVLLSGLLFALSLPVAAQQDITGTWRGALTVAPDTSLTIDFVLTREADGGYSAIVASPDPGGIPEVPVSRVEFAANRLVLAVDALGGAYEGTLGDDSIEGEWRQEGETFPLVLRRYERTELSEADRERLVGSWTGALELPTGVSLALVFRFETGDDGELIGMLDSPEQGASDIAMADIELAGDALTLNVPQIMGRYIGTIQGDRITGSWSQGGSIPLTLERGEYVPTVIELDLSADDVARLTGSWRGQVGPLEVIIRIQTNDDGTPVATLNVPAQGVGGLPVTAAQLTGDQLTLRIDTVGVTLIATLDGDQLSGDWQQGPESVPVTLSR